MKSTKLTKKKDARGHSLKNSQLFRPDVHRWHVAGVRVCHSLINNVSTEYCACFEESQTINFIPSIVCLFFKSFSPKQITTIAFDLSNVWL